MQTLRRKVAICRRAHTNEQSRTAKPSQSRSRGFLKLSGFQELLHCLLDACMPLSKSLVCTVAQTAMEQDQGEVCNACSIATSNSYF
jgi:hypothetical protein